MVIAMAISNANRASTNLAAAAGRAPLRVPRRPRRATLTRAGEPEEFVRSDFQQKIKDADSAVKEAQQGVGQALTGFLESSGLGKALGIKSPQNESSSTGRSGQSAKWMRARDVLVKGGLKSVDGKEAQRLVADGGILLDVRPKEDWSKFTAKGSGNAQYYKYPTTEDLANPKTLLRQTLLRSQGVGQAVEANTEFISDALEAIGDASTVIVCCSNGGTMTATENFPAGQSSRSLLAAAELMRSGSKVKVYHLAGGLNSWFKQGLDGEGSDDAYSDTSDRVPFVAGYSVPQDADDLL